MDPSQIEILGYIAATITSVSFFPQVLKIIRTKETKDISLWMYIAISVGLACWLSYGLLTDNGPIIYANMFTLTQCLIILGYKMKFK